MCLYNTVESPVFIFIFIFSKSVSSNYDRDCGHPRAVSEHWPLQFFLEHSLPVSLSLNQLMPNNDEVGSLKLKSFDIFCFRSEFSYSETCLAS